MTATVGPDPARVRTLDDLVTELDRLRRHAARGTGRGRVSLDELARRTGVPRSTVHAYVTGARTPTPDALDLVVTALGVRGAALGRWADALERAAARRAPATVVPRQLPARPIGFRGRATELGRLDEVARAIVDDADAPRIVALTGSGGVGKTATVVRWAHEHAGDFPDGQLWVDLRGFGSTPPVAAADALEHLLRSVGVNTSQLPIDVAARAALFRSAVAGRRLLLVLDNARDAEQVQPLLPGAGGVLTLITSRDRLPALVIDGAVRVAMQPLAADESMALLTDELPPTLAASPALSRIADRCAGLPLTLRIVRERFAAATPAELDHFADLLDSAAPLDAFELPDVHGSVGVRAALGWSYRALPTDVATCFRLLPLCHVPVVDARCVAVLLDADLRTARSRLGALYSANLVDRIDVDTFRVHDLVFAFARECLDADEPSQHVDEARERLLRFLCLVADRAAADLDPSRPARVRWTEQPPRVSTSLIPDAPELWVQSCVDMVRAAVTDATRRGRVELGCLLAERAWRVLRWVGDVGLIAREISTVREALDDSVVAGTSAVMCSLLGLTAALRGQLTEAENEFVATAELALQAGDDELRAFAYANRAIVWSIRGDLIPAIRAMTEIAASTEPHLTRVSTYEALSDFELQRGDITAAQVWLDRAIAAAGHAHGGALELELETSSLRILVANGADATARLDAAEVRARRAGNHELLARILALKAHQCIEKGDRDAARSAATEASTIARSTASTAVRIAADLALVESDLLDGRSTMALARVDRILTSATHTRSRYDEATTLLWRARALALEGDLVTARAEAARAHDMATESGYLQLARLAGDLLSA